MEKYVLDEYDVSNWSGHRVAEWCRKSRYVQISAFVFTFLLWFLIVFKNPFRNIFHYLSTLFKNLNFVLNRSITKLALDAATATRVWTPQHWLSMKTTFTAKVYCLQNNFIVAILIFNFEGICKNQLQTFCFHHVDHRILKGIRIWPDLRLFLTSFFM